MMSSLIVKLYFFLSSAQAVTLKFASSVSLSFAIVSVIVSFTLSNVGLSSELTFKII